MFNKALPVQTNLIIPGEELRIQVSTSGGPGGQHVNKTSTKVTLRWNVETSNVLQEGQRRRIMASVQQRLNAAGELVVHVSDTRSQRRNLLLARERLAQLIREALHKPKVRKKTKMPRAVNEKRLAKKRNRSQTKKNRQQFRPED